ncbi:MAG: WecB/TagA/CpsF family glycosyltransferase [Methylocystaceae bacterium]
MQNARVNILGSVLDNVSMEQAVNIISEMISGGTCHQVITLNAEIIYQAVNDPALQNLINHADLVTPDGAGVVWAARYLQHPVKERVTGIDLVIRLVKEGAARGWRFFFLGAAPGVAAEAAQKMGNLYPGLQVAGINHGYFGADDEAGIIDSINESGANILLVGLGAPRQDFWINTYKDRLNCQVAIGVGGSFDVLAERLNRAPDWMIRLNLEWFYRLVKEPSRWRRQLALPRFAGLVLKAKKNN